MIPEIELTRAKFAIFSEDGLYRYLLVRNWSYPVNKLLLFIGLNASTANGLEDDPTVSRLIFRAYTAGFGGLLCANLAAAVTPDPKRMRKMPDPIGPLNDEYISAALGLTDGAALLGWGQLIKGFAFLEKRADKVIKMVKEPYCLGTTKGEYPRHPLYVPYSQQLEKF